MWLEEKPAVVKLTDGIWSANVKQPESASDVQVGGTHYLSMGVEPWDVVDTWPLEQQIGFYRGNALKYIMRMGNKDEASTEVGKGKHYLEKLLEVLNEDGRNQRSSTLSGNPEAIVRKAASPVRTLYALNLIEACDHCYFEIHGNAFLHHMVRNLMGSLMEVGQHRQAESWLRDVLESRNRSLAAKTYPAQGLSLWNIEYSEQYGIQELFS